MPVYVSSIGPLLDALEEGLVAKFSATSVDVIGGLSGRDAGRDAIYIGDVEGDQAPAALGRDRRKESYLAIVTISCVRPNADHRGARDRALELMLDVEDFLADDRTVNGAVSEASVETFALTKHTEADGTREGRVRLAIRCKRHRIRA